MEDEDYFPYEDEEKEEKDNDAFWGTYAVTCPDIDDSTSGMNYKTAFFASIIYEAALFYQKEIAVGMGAWTKKPLWDAQESYVDALYQFWLSRMDDYLASIREEKKENKDKRGIPVINREHMRERNKF